MEMDSVPMEEKRADTETQLEVDEAILDYLAYKATKAVLRDFQNARDPSAQDTRKQRCALSLELVDSFLVMFREMHPGHQGTQQLQLRLRLLSFATIFTRREYLEGLGSRTRELRSRHSSPPSHQETAKKSRSRMHVPKTNKQLPTFEAPRGNEDPVLWTEFSERATGKMEASLPLVSLLDSLPFFMALSAAEIAIQETKITDTWMRLAAGYMAQAVIEQLLLYGLHSDEILEEAFAWGFDLETVAREGSEDWLANAMFFDEEAEFDSWAGIRDEHMLALTPPTGRRVLDHFMLLRESELPLSAFEHAILNFLEGLLYDIPRPILVQRESGKIEESLPLRHDTQIFKERVGIV